MKKFKMYAAALLVLSMSLTPCLAGMGLTKAAEPEGPQDGGKEPATTYEVTLKEAEHGSIQFDGSKETVQAFAEGQSVALHITSDKGYALEKLSIQEKATEKEVASSTEGDTFTFNMPAADLTVSASFKESKEAEVQGEVKEPEAKPDTSETESVKFKIVGEGQVTLCGADEKEVTLTEGEKTLTMPNHTYIHLTASTKKAGIKIEVKSEDGVDLERTSFVKEKSFWRDITVTKGLAKTVTITFGKEKAKKAYKASLLAAGNRGTEAQPEVGDVYSGTCMVAAVDGGDGHTVHSVTVGSFAGVLAGATIVADCADHSAAAPDEGMRYNYTYNVTSVDKTTGNVVGSLHCVSQVDPTTGHDTDGDGKLNGYQGIDAANVGIHKNYNGFAKLKKSSSNPSITDGNRCYSLAGAVYGVYTDDACTHEVAELTTNANGESNTVSLLPLTYYVKEKKAPKGYQKYLEKYKITVTVNQTTVLEVEDKPKSDPMGISLEKIDAETGENGLLLGAASLEGAEFTINYYDGYYTKDNLPAEPTRTWVIATKKRQNEEGKMQYFTKLSDAYKVSGDEFYYKKNGIPTIPLGTISVEETKAPEGYLLEHSYLRQAGDRNAEKIEGIYVSQVTEDNEPPSLVGGNLYEVCDYVKRGDFAFTKHDEETQVSMANIPFQITSKTTGETHTIQTDENGYFTSETRYIPHSQNTNSEEVNSGLWFGQYDGDKMTEPNDEFGALPYDTYTLEELRCDANQNKKLYKGEFTVSRDKFTVELGTLDNHDLEVELHTTAWDKAGKDKLLKASPSVTIVDTVEYKGLVPGESYSVEGVLMDQGTGKTLLVNGQKVTGKAEFTAKEENGSVDVEFTFNSQSLGGKDLVVFEKLYDASGKEIGNHEDINDKGQTVKVGGPNGTVQTGDTMMLYALAGIAFVLSVVGGCMFLKKKNK